MDGKRGSDWIKCDLHIHSPASFFHLYGDRNNPEIWEKFLSDLEALPSDFKIIGINDYLTIEGYKRILQEKQNGRLGKIDCILPVVEFRINRLVGEGQTKRLNYHVVFSDKINLTQIESQFFPALSASYTLESGNSETHPDKKAPYHVIKSVRFSGAGEVFTDKPIQFSSYLNSIIGGKSTGKSLLGGLIVKSSEVVPVVRTGLRRS